MSSKLKIGLVDPDKALLEEGHELFSDIFDEVKSMTADCVERFLGNTTMDLNIINEECGKLLGRKMDLPSIRTRVSKKKLKKALRAEFRNASRQQNPTIVGIAAIGKSRCEPVEKRTYNKRSMKSSLVQPALKGVVVSRCKSTTCLSPVGIAPTQGKRRKLAASNLDVVFIQKRRVAYRKEVLSAKNAEKKHMLAELNRASAQGSKNRRMSDVEIIASNAIYMSKLRSDIDLIN